MFACVCVFFFLLWTYSTYLLFGNIFELIRAFCIFYFSPFFCVNYSLNLDEDTLHRNTVAARKEPIMTISEKVYLRCCVRFSTSSGCLKSGAFLFFGQASVGVRHIKESHFLFHRCFLFVPFFPDSICCHPSWYTSVHPLCNACLLSLCGPIL